MSNLIKSIIFSILTSEEIQDLVVDLFGGLVEKTDNKLDDNAHKVVKTLIEHGRR